MPALSEGDRQGFCQLLQPFFRINGKRLSRDGVDQLDDSAQFTAVSVDDRCSQHLFGAVAALAVDILEEGDAGIVGFQLLIVIHILDVDDGLVERHIARHALR